MTEPEVPKGKLGLPAITLSASGKTQPRPGQQAIIPGTTSINVRPPSIPPKSSPLRSSGTLPRLPGAPVAPVAPVQAAPAPVTQPYSPKQVLLFDYDSLTRELFATPLEHKPDVTNGLMYQNQTISLLYTEENGKNLCLAFTNVTPHISFQDLLGRLSQPSCGLISLIDPRTKSPLCEIYRCPEAGQFGGESYDAYFTAADTLIKEAVKRTGLRTLRTKQILDEKVRGLLIGAGIEEDELARITISYAPEA